MQITKELTSKLQQLTTLMEMHNLCGPVKEYDFSPVKFQTSFYETKAGQTMARVALQLFHEKYDSGLTPGSRIFFTEALLADSDTLVQIHIGLIGFVTTHIKHFFGDNQSPSKLAA